MDQQTFDDEAEAEEAAEEGGEVEGGKAAEAGAGTPPSFASTLV